MACEKIKVCHNTRCKNQGAPLAIQDIEDLVQGNCHVEKCGCLGKCGLGPNVEIEIDGVPTIHSGIRTFETTLSLVEDTADICVDPQVAKLGQAKWAARHMTDPSERLSMIEACIKQVDQEVKDMPLHPKLMADVLVMRSKELLSTTPERALEDAAEAARLVPNWAQSLLSLAAACEATRWPTRGLAAARGALKTGKCHDKAEVRKMISRLKPLADEEEADPEKYKKLRDTHASASAPGAALVRAPTQDYTSNIYAKFGGRPKFKELAYAVHDAMFKHPATKDFFPPTMDNSRITERNVDFLIGAFGGPKYRGPDMIDTHEFLRITDHQYDVMMDCYRDAIENMHIHDQFSVPILRQLEGMRSSIVYQKNRPGPLARKFDHYMDKHKESRQKDKSRKRHKDKSKTDGSEAPSKNEHVADPNSGLSAGPNNRRNSSKELPQLPQVEPLPKAKAKAGAKARAKAKAKAKAIDNSPTEDQPEPKDGISNAETSALVEQDTDASSTKCPVSGRETEDGSSQGTCPFLAFLGAPGAPPEKLPLLQSLKDGQVSLADPQAEPSSSHFGVVSM